MSGAIPSPDGEFPSLLKVRAEVRDHGLLLRAPAMPDLEVAWQEGGPRREVLVFDDACEALDSGARANRWFGDYLGTQCRPRADGPGLPAAR